MEFESVGGMFEVFPSGVRDFVTDHVYIVSTVSPALDLEISEGDESVQNLPDAAPGKVEKGCDVSV